MSRTLEFTESEMMICAAARLIEDDKSYFIGFGMPQIALVLAQKLYAPNVLQVYEVGSIAPQIVLPFDPLQMADSRGNYRAISWTNMNQLFFQCSMGYLDYGVLGINEIDQYGNINTTLIGGTYQRPGRRLSGSGGANEIASLCWRTIVVAMQERRRFVKKLDFITSPGYLDGSPQAREKAGLPKGSGPYRVVTSKALFGFDEETRKMKLLATMPGSEVDDVLHEMQFRPLIAEEVGSIAPPSPEELRLLREEIDPRGSIIGKGKRIRVEV